MLCSTCTVTLVTNLANVGSGSAHGAYQRSLTRLSGIGYRPRHKAFSHLLAAALSRFIFVHLMPELAVGGRDLTELDHRPVPLPRRSPKQGSSFCMVGTGAFFVLDVRTKKSWHHSIELPRIHAVLASISAIVLHTRPPSALDGTTRSCSPSVLVASASLIDLASLAQISSPTRPVGSVSRQSLYFRLIPLPQPASTCSPLGSAFFSVVLLLHDVPGGLRVTSRARVPWFLLGVSVMTVFCCAHRLSHWQHSLTGDFHSAARRTVRSAA